MIQNYPCIDCGEKRKVVISSKGIPRYLRCKKCHIKHLKITNPKPSLGKHWKLTDETKNKMSQSGKGRQHLNRRGIPSGAKGKHWKLSLKSRMNQSKARRGYHIKSGLKGKKRSPTMIAKMTATKRLQCKNHEFVRKMMARFSNRKTKPEIAMEEILNSYYPKEWKYVGLGDVIIGGKCPDFVNINGKKQIIEVFGRYWHKPEDVDKRINTFTKYGYATLIFWEDEINIQSVTDKIKELSKVNI
jgi:very-short-patch-repair endonuclease/DNA-directed RNA polymerase subunit RPC12/RpoP